MVLSACSPYFQALFVNHPEKHPIVILKDVPFADMKSLLDFMYRGEVSVDQERLSAFLRVAESLRIKGLTEVNDEKSTTSSRDQSETPPTTQNRVHPYVLQQQQQRKVLQQQQQQQASQQSSQQSTNNPLLGSALSMPKRKRGRPRKLSGSDDVDDYDDDYRENLLQVEKTPTRTWKMAQNFIVLFACCCRNHQSYWKSKWEQKTIHHQRRMTIADEPTTMTR
jgi:tramtrack